MNETNLAFMLMTSSTHHLSICPQRACVGGTGRHVCGEIGDARDARGGEQHGLEHRLVRARHAGQLDVCEMCVRGGGGEKGEGGRKGVGVRNEGFGLTSLFSP